MKFKKIVVIFFLLIALLVQQGEAEIVDGIVAIVNEDIITKKELESVLKPYATYIKKKYTTKSDREKAFLFIRKQNIKSLIEQKLIVQRAKLLGVKVSKEEVDSSVENIKKDNSIDDEELEKKLNIEGLTIESLKNKIREQILYSKISNYRIKAKIVVTNEDIENYYKDNIEKYGGVQKYHIRNILIKTPQFMDDFEKAKIIVKIAKIEKKLDIGIPFDIIAKKFSEADNSISGGSLGFIEKNDIVKTIRDEIDKIDVGEYTKTVEIKEGFQIFYIEEIKKEKGVPIDSVREEIEKKLYKKALEKQFKEWVEELRATAYIKIVDNNER